MPSQGPNNWGSQSDDGACYNIFQCPPPVAWSGVGTGTATLNNPGAGFDTSDLISSNYGFTIPSTATILGIQVSVTRKAALAGGGALAQDNVISLVKAGSLVGNNEAAAGTWPSSLTAQGYGGTSDLWGTTWTPSDINGSGFGVAVSALVSEATLTVTTVTVTITYSNSQTLTGAVTLSVTATFTPANTVVANPGISLGVTAGLSVGVTMSTVAMNIVLGVTGTIKTDGGQAVSLGLTAGFSPSSQLVTGPNNITLGVVSGFLDNGTKLLFSPTPAQQVPCPFISSVFYTNLITSEHNVRPNFMASVAALVQAEVDLQNQYLQFPCIFDLDFAVGDQLDKIGLWVGASRNIPIPITGVFFSWGIVGLGWGQGVWAGVGTPTPVAGTRIQSSGGSNNIKYQVDLGPGVRGTQYSFSVFVKNQGTTPVKVTASAGGVILGTVQPGVTTLLTGSIFETGNNCGLGVPCDVQLRFETLSPSNSMDIVAYLPLISANNGPNLLLGPNLIFAGNWAGFGGSTITLTQNVPLVINSVSTSLSTLNDQNYRTLLRARIAANAWDGTVPGIYNIWAIVFALENFQVLIQDNQNMSMTVILLTSALIDAVSLALVTSGLIIPRPAGVQITGYVQTQAPIFGWGLNTPLVQGWGLGNWI